MSFSLRTSLYPGFLQNQILCIFTKITKFETMKVCTFQPFPQKVVNAKLKQTIVENQGIRSPTPTGFVMDILLNCGGSCFIIVSYQTFCPPLQGKFSDCVFIDEPALWSNA